MSWAERVRVAGDEHGGGGGDDDDEASASRRERGKPAGMGEATGKGKGVVDVVAEARKSRFSDSTGKVHCITCRKAFATYKALEQHLSASHGGLNASDAALLLRGNAKAARQGPLPHASTSISGSRRAPASLNSYFDAKPRHHQSRIAENLRGESGGGGGRVPRTASEKGRGNVLVSNTNTASSVAMVVRRRKEREGGRKEKISSIKAAVLIARSEQAVEAERRRKAKCEEMLRLEQSKLDDASSREASAEECDACAAKIKALSEELGERERKLRAAELQLQKLVVSPQVNTEETIGEGDVEDDSTSCSSSGSGGESPNDASEKVDAKANQIRCEVCNIVCPNRFSYNQHCEGKLHKGKCCEALRSEFDHNDARMHNPPGPPASFVGPETTSTYAGEQLITQELNAAATELLKRLLELQSRAHKRDPIKAKAKKRIVFGFNEVRKSVRLGKSKMLLVVPNIAEVQQLMEAMEGVVDVAKGKGIPVVYVLTKSKMGSLVKRGVRISMASVLDHSGAEKQVKDFWKALEAASEERRKWEEERQAANLNANAEAFVPMQPRVPGNLQSHSPTAAPTVPHLSPSAKHVHV